MYQSLFTKLLFVALAILTIAGCQHETDTFDGPNLIDRFGAFTVLEDFQASQETVDFAAGESVFFTARFNKNVNWVVTITGMESGAVKRIEAFDQELTIDNATWLGGTTDLPFFKQEMCSVSLTIPEEPDYTGTAMVEVLTPKVYEGNLFTDFETEPGADLLLGNFEFELTGNTKIQEDSLAVQGNRYYFFEGTDNVVSNFFVGLIDIKASITGETYAPVPTTVPEDLYFNCFIYSDAGPHGIAVIQFIYDTNNSGAFEDGEDTAFQITGDYPLTWEGWQHIHHPMSELGMTQEQLEKIVAIRVLLISNMNTQPNPPVPVDFGLDYLSFTKDGPLEL